MTNKITQQEIQQLFGPTMPIEAVTLLQDATSPDDAREKLRRLAQEMKADIAAWFSSGEPVSAERNTAEPDILSVRAERALGQIPAPDKAPVVEVTQARECVKEIFGFTDETLDAAGDDKRPIETVSRYITEAEARGESRYKPWHDAVIDELIVDHIYSEKHDNDPRKALQDAIAWNVTVALDPRVSGDAKELIARGRRDALEEAITKIGSMKTGRSQPIVMTCAEIIDELKRLMTEGK